MSKNKKVELKLEVDLVPASSWSKSLRTAMKRSAWEKLRKQEIEKAGSKCSICSSTENLHCHEIWDFNDQTYKQTLLGFEIICKMCHHVHHFGNSNILASQGKLNINDVIGHFLVVNGVEEEEFKKHLASAQKLWKKRSKASWQVDLGEWSILVEPGKLEELNNPELKFLRSIGVKV